MEHSLLFAQIQLQAVASKGLQGTKEIPFLIDMKAELCFSLNIVYKKCCLIAKTLPILN